LLQVLDHLDCSTFLIGYSKDAANRFLKFSEVGEQVIFVSSVVQEFMKFRFDPSLGPVLHVCGCEESLLPGFNWVEGEVQVQLKEPFLKVLTLPLKDVRLGHLGMVIVGARAS
jgi:hypothetical protein